MVAQGKISLMFKWGCVHSMQVRDAVFHKGNKELTSLGLLSCQLVLGLGTDSPEDITHVAFRMHKA